MYPTLFTKFLFPFYESRIAGRRTCEFIAEYAQQGKLTRSELAAIQLTKLQALLQHASTQCAFYREQWQQLGFDVNQVQDVSALEALPILDKETITENYSGFVSALHAGKNIAKATGGSSGVPFRFELDGESNERRQGVMWRGYGAVGAGLGVKTLYVWGAHIAPVGKKTQIKDALYNRFYNRKILNSFAMTEDNVTDYIAAHNQYRAKAVVGYVNPLVTMAQAILAKGERVHRPEAILTGAEPLYEFQRECIERAFGAPVYNTYGCREFMLIGSECQQRDGLHANIDHLVVEIVNAEGKTVAPGEVGDVLITDLHNYGFPLIRYRNGDRAAWKTDHHCACGSALPMLAGIEGRKLDVIKTPDGRLLPGEFFPHLLKDFAAIQQFQIVQQEIERVTMKVVLQQGASDADLAPALALIRDNLGEAITLELDVVSDIPLTASGKRRVTISLLSEHD